MEMRWLERVVLETIMELVWLEQVVLETIMEVPWLAQVVLVTIMELLWSAVGPVESRAASVRPLRLPEEAVLWASLAALESVVAAPAEPRRALGPSCRRTSCG